MELITILGLIVCIIAAVLCIIYFILRWKSWSPSIQDAVITQLYAVAKTLWHALSDGSISPAELRQLFTAVLGVIAAARGVNLNTVEQEFPALKTGQQTAEEPEPPEPPLRILGITLDEETATHCGIMYEDEFCIPEKLELNRDTTIYAIVEAPANHVYHVSVENTRGQNRTLFHNPGPDEPDTTTRTAFPLEAPEPNGWTLNSNGTAATYNITITADNGEYYVRNTIPATIIQ